MDLLATFEWRTSLIRMILNNANKDSKKKAPTTSVRAPF